MREPGTDRSKGTHQCLLQEVNRLGGRLGKERDMTFIKSYLADCDSPHIYTGIPPTPTLHSGTRIWDICTNGLYSSMESFVDNVVCACLRSLAPRHKTCFCFVTSSLSAFCRASERSHVSFSFHTLYLPSLTCFDSSGSMTDQCAVFHSVY